MFPGSRATLVMDLISVAVLILVIALTFSILLVRGSKNYLLHRRINIILGYILFIAVIIFEIDVRVRGWEHAAKTSIFYDNWLFPVLYLHIFIATVAGVLFFYTLIAAYKKYPLKHGKLQYPKQSSFAHKKLAWTSYVFLWLTALSGGVFYFMAFVA